MATKCRFFTTIEREEQWLNRQIANGRKLTGPVGGGLYYFIDQPCYSKVIRIDIRKFKTKAERLAYLQFMEDAGWHGINGRRSERKYYFIGDRDQSDELFSDNQSKYEREVRARNGLIGLNFTIVAYFILLFYSEWHRLILVNPQAAFLTPGLWNKEGEAFAKAFLFELPLAVVRIGLSLLPVILIGYFIYQLVMVQRSINKFKSLKD